MCNLKLSFCGHRVSINNGLPQRRVLLFNICTSTLHGEPSNKVEVFQYVDDFLIVVTGNFREEAEDILRKRTCLFTNQCSWLKLFLSLEKSWIVAFSSVRSDVFRFNVNSVLIEYKKFITFLGKMISSLLTVKDHVGHHWPSKKSYNYVQFYDGWPVGVFTPERSSNYIKGW